MSTARKRLPLLFAFAAILMFSAPLLAQDWRYPQVWQNQGQREAYDNGYRKGLGQGRDDAKDRRAFDYARDKDYRNADSGYKGRYGNKEWYRNEFRRGYAAGYEQGYNQYAPGAYNRGYNRPYYGNPGYYGNGGYYGNDGTYPGRAIPRGGVAVNAGYDRGYREGLEKGSDDARHNRAFDYVRQGWYRSADRGYDRDYGPKIDYQNSYRRGFAAGYAEAYRNANRYYR